MGKKVLPDGREPLPLNVAMQGYTRARAWQTAHANNVTFDYWLHRLRTLAIASFEWLNVPDSIDPRFIELCELDYGLGGFFDMSGEGDEGFGAYAFAQATPLNRLNLYWNPNRVRFIPANGGGGWIRNAYFWTQAHRDGLTVNKPDAVVMWDNMNRIPILPILMTYAYRLADIDRTIDMNMRAQKMPYIISVPETQRRDAIHLYQQVVGNEPLIMKNNSAASSLELTVQQALAPYVAHDLLADQARIFNQILSLLGIDNSNTEKRERLLTNEVESNDEEIMLMRRSRLYNRQRFCEQVNERFGLDMDVRYWAGESDAYDDTEQGMEEVNPDSNIDQNSDPAVEGGAGGNR